MWKTSLNDSEQSQQRAFAPKEFSSFHIKATSWKTDYKQINKQLLCLSKIIVLLLEKKWRLTGSETNTEG